MSLSKSKRSYFSGSDLKTILHSKRANIYYLEHCRVMQKDGRVLYLTETDKENLYYNIPIANTTCLLLGTGTSVTQAAMRLLSQAGVLVGFCGGGGTPLLMGTEIAWFTPQSEYRETQYVQGWLSWWFDEQKRLQAAQQLQLARLNFLEQVWSKDSVLQQAGFDSDTPEMMRWLREYRGYIVQCGEVSQLLALEGRMSKHLYHLAASQTGYEGFVRNSDGVDKANVFLNHGNYLAYGLAATVTWVLGIPHAFAVMHGKTRRGALVFDVADLIKDAIVLPLAFISAQDNVSEQDFRQMCLNYFVDYQALDTMFDEVKKLALR